MLPELSEPPHPIPHKKAGSNQGMQVQLIAFVWSYKMGEVEAAKNPIPVKSHGRLSKSLFRLGLDCLRSILASIERKMSEFLLAVGLLKCFGAGAT